MACPPQLVQSDFAKAVALLNCQVCHLVVGFGRLMLMPEIRLQ